MTLAELQKAVRDLLVILAPGSKIIWANESGVRPELPYLSLNIVTPSIRIGSRDALVETDVGVWQLHGQRQAFVSANAYGLLAMQTALNIQNGLETEAALSYMRANKISIMIDSDLRDLSLLEDTKIEKRAQFDLTVGYTVSIDEAIEPIESVEVTNVISGDTIVVDI